MSPFTGEASDEILYLSYALRLYERSLLNSMDYLATSIGIFRSSYCIVSIDNGVLINLLIYEGKYRETIALTHLVIK